MDIKLDFTKLTTGPTESKIIWKCEWRDRPLIIDNPTKKQIADGTLSEFQLDSMFVDLHPLYYPVCSFDLQGDIKHTGISVDLIFDHEAKYLQDQNNELLLIASDEYSKQILGTCIYEPNYGVFALRALYVLPQFRRNHIAKTMLEVARKYLRCDHIQCLSDNVDGLSFYCRCGYTVIGYDEHQNMTTLYHP